MERFIKYFRHGTFSAEQLTARNPYLQIGEAIFELGGDNTTQRVKVGPGFWNELDYLVDDIYIIATAPTNPIGDATGNLSGLNTREILELMLHPYTAPIISNPRNNAGGLIATTRILEIGAALSGTIQVLYTVSNTTGLSGPTPINITAGGLFSNEGNHPNTGSASMVLPAPLNPPTIVTYPITLRANHIQGLSSPVTTSISFYPKLIWGISSLTSYTADNINGLSSKQTALAASYKRDYLFTGQGYCVVAIPVMLNPSNMIFTDVTDPSAPAGFSMEDLGTLSINNGVGTYLYQILRSTYYITEPTSILRIS